MPEHGEAGVAFFDVDETLVSVRTLEAFLFHYWQRQPDLVTAERIRELRAEVVRLERAEFNRRYFALWAGQRLDRVEAAGRAWYRAASGEPGFFRPNVVERLDRHRRSGDRIVLISGSFAPPLRPLAAAVGADALYCTELAVDDTGVLTGEISATMLGDDKRRAVDDFLARAAAPPARTWAYGDHPSDLALLDHVTDPVVVGTDPALTAIAAERGWPVLDVERPLAPRAEHD